ncbi:laminin [Opitutaceae bacterium TAV5]|nr:laminin [Opitutaceae bacterium TAV5]
MIRPLFSFLPIFCLTLATPAGAPATERPNAVAPEFPPFVLFHGCPQWASARGHQDYHRYNFDRPFAPGDTPNRVWQLRTMLEHVPGGVFGTYLFFQNLDRLDRPAIIFEEYLEAAKSVEGAAIVPIVHAIGPAAERPQKLKALVEELLNRHADHPAWFRLNGLPVIVDYAAGGLGVERAEELAALIASLRAEGRRFIWLTHGVGGLSFAVNGKVDEPQLAVLLQATEGAYNFSAPLPQGLGGLADLATAVRRTPGRLFGGGFNPGYYSSRLNGRNYISQQGTWRLRQALELLAETKPDFLQVATWNDWVEATSFEPSYNHTTALLDIVRHYADRMFDRPPPASDRPRVIVSYRKNIFPGEPLDIEILSLPVAPGYETVSGTLTLRDQAGGVLATLPWGPLSGRSAEATTVTWTVPATATRDMLRPEVTVNAAAFSQTYRQLAPVPVVTNSVQADMLYFNVPLHRLRIDAQPVLLVNGRPGGQPSLAGPRLLVIDPASAATAGTAVAGVSYLKNGHVINDPLPDTASRAVVDNWPGDPLLTGMIAHDYYGALVGYADGTIAYATGQWAADAAWPDTAASYQFELESLFPRLKIGRDKLIDTSGHKLHGQLGRTDQAGKAGRPAWKNLSDRWDALQFNGKDTFVDIPLAAMPAGPVTVQLLVQPSEKPGRQQEIFIQRGANLSLRIAANGKFEARRLNTRRDFDLATGSTTLKPGQWYHVTATYDMTRLRLYVNGVEEASVPSNGLRSPEKIRLGGPFGDTENDAIIDRTRGDSWFKGRIAHLRILNGAARPDAIVGDHRELAQVLAAANP